MKKLFALIALLPMLAACGSTDVAQTTPRPVTTAIAARASLPAHLALTGTLAPDTTTIVSAKMSGKIAWLGADVGTRITARTPLAALERETADTALASVERNLIDARRTVTTTRALYDERIASIKQTIATTRTTGTKNIAVLDAQLAAARSAIGRGGDTSLTNVAITLEQTIDTLDRVLGVSSKYAPLNDSFENYLGALDMSAKTTAEDTLRVLIHTHAVYRTDFDARILNKKPTSDERETNTTLAIETLQAAKTALDKTYNVLLKSITSADFTGAQLDGYKTSVTTLGGQIENLLLAMKTLRDSSTDISDIAVIERTIDKAHADIDAQIETLTLAVSAAEKEKTAQLAVATAAITTLENEARMRGITLDDTRVAAPTSGIITKKFVEVGSVIAPGTPLFEITDDSTLKLTIGVPDDAAASLPVGREATITVDGIEGKIFIGRISRVDPTADPMSKKIAIEIRIDNTRHTLTSGQFARVAFAMTSESGVIIPASALIARYDATLVYVAANGIAEERSVTVGTRSDTAVIITSGLRDGETVITKGATYLRDGDPIIIQN